MSTETQARLEQLRNLNRPLTQAEEAEAIRLVREDRVSAAYAAKNSKSKSTVAKASPADVLEKLKAMMPGVKK